MWRYEILNASDKILNVAIDAERTFRYEQPKVQKVTPVFIGSAGGSIQNL